MSSEDNDVWDCTVKKKSDQTREEGLSDLIFRNPILASSMTGMVDFVLNSWFDRCEQKTTESSWEYTQV